MQEIDFALAHRMLGAGVPLELDEGASHGMYPARPGLLIYQVGGVPENTAFDLDRGGTGYILDLEITSNISRLIVIRDFRLDLPWLDARFYFLPDPADSGSSCDAYILPGTAIAYPRSNVINHRTSSRGRLRRGETLDGLLLAVGFEPIPDCFRHGGSVDSMLSIVDQFGRSHSSEVSFWIDRSVTLDRGRSKATPAQLRSRCRTRLRLGLEEDAQASAR